MSKYGKPLSKRFTLEPSTGCWIWNGYKLPGGYGRWTFRGKVHLAHRVTYFLIKGSWPKQTLDHKCRNRACINPDHMDDVSQAINIRRGKKTKLTTGQVKEIRATYVRAYGNHVKMQRKYGISERQLDRILHGEQWR